MTTDDKPAPGPAGWSCGVCGLFPQVRGCVPGKCETPAEPVEHPAPNLPPWRWEEKDGRRWLVDGDGHPVPTGRIAGDKIVDSHESELQRAAPEMASLLHEWKGYSGWVHDDCDCLYCRTMRVLARIDAASK